MAVLLLPGRHLANTHFQESYLAEHLQVPVDRLPLLGARTCRGAIDEVVFAITSANQSHSRYNPIPLEVRAIGVDRFARSLREALSVRCRIVPIPHYGPTPHFVQFLLKEIAEATEGDVVLSPENAVVLTSTPEVIDQFLALGFGVLQGELVPRDPLRFAETWIGKCKFEALDHFVCFSLAHLDPVAQAYVEYHNELRPHQSKGNEPLRFEGQARPVTSTKGAVACRELLGGLLKHYYRQAA